MQHLQHNFKVNYWFNIKLCEDIRISKPIDKETNLQTKFIIKCSASGPKVTTKSTFVIKFNVEWITLAVKQISGITVQKKLVWVIKEQNMQTFILHPIFASIHVQKWTLVKHDLFHCLERDRKSPPQRRNRSSIIFREMLIWREVCWTNSLPSAVLY